MIQVFKCPSCGSTVSYEGGPEPTITCQFCGSTIIVPEELRAKVAPAPRISLDAGHPGLPLDRLAEIKQALSEGKKIEAIKLFREATGLGLKEAKDAVEALERGDPVVLSSSSTFPLTAEGFPDVNRIARLSEVAVLAQQGQKIEAIKLYRQITSVGLKEAKDAVEAMEAGQPWNALPQVTFEATALAEVKSLLQAGQKIEAIKHYRQITGVGLKEAKDAVEAMEAGQLWNALPQATFTGADEAATLAEVKSLLQAGQKIDAIKLFRKTFDTGLIEAKEAVEAIEAGRDPELARMRVRQAATMAAKPLATARPRSKATGAGCGLLIAGFALSGVALVFGGPFRLSGSYAQALAAAQADPQVIAALGAPVAASWWPITGSLSCGDEGCLADYNIPIHGSQRSGRILVESHSQDSFIGLGGTWELDAVVFVEGGPSIVLTPPPPERQVEGPAPTLSAAQVDATSGAISRATAAVQATRDAQATAAEKAKQDATATAAAEATKQAARQATRTAEAEATATAASLILASQKAWPVALSDSFDDNRNSWHTGSIRQTGFNAQRRLADGQYSWNITSQHDIFWSTWPDRGQTFADFYASVDGHSTRDGAPTYGLIFRLVDENNFYYFGLNDDGYYHFDVYEDGDNVSLPIVFGAEAARRGGVNRLAVSASGSHFILLVNDQVVGAMGDDRFGEGEIGLGMTAYEQGGEASVVFDNFEVHAP